VSNIQASLVSKKEVRIETFQQLIERKDIKILVNRESYAYKVIQRVIF